MEQLANNAQSSLNGAITSGATSLVVNSAANFPTSGNFRITIDSEILLVTAVSGTTFTVTRGVEGTTAAGHSNGATVTHILTAASLVKIPGLILLEEHSASSSTELDFTNCLNNSNYDEFVIEINNLVVNTNNVNLILEVSTNGGSSYDQTSGNYRWANYGWTSTTAGQTGSTSDTSITLVNNIGTGVANYSINGSCKIFNPAGSLFKMFTGQFVAYNNTNSAPEGFVNFGVYLSTTAINAFRIRPSSGNLTSGIIRVYGVNKG